MEEIWKPIKDFDNYSISNLGRVKDNTTDMFKKTSANERGYLRVFLTKNKKHYTKYVHRLVAKAYIPNPENKPTVNHINGIKDDNRVENLEWATYKEQMEHAIRTGLIKTGEESPVYGRKLKQETIEKIKLKRNDNKGKFNKPINQYKLNGEYVKTWESINEAIRNYKNNAIEFCCKGKRKSASGYQWKFYTGETNNIEPKEQGKNERHILQYDLQGNFIREWNNIKEACLEYNAFNSNISACCSGNIKTVKGYIWKYKGGER